MRYTPDLTYAAAMERLWAGARIRQPHWNDESWMELSEGEPVMNLGGRLTTCAPRENEIASSDWIAYEQ